jgi:predicted RNase H-like nuclease
MVAGVDACRGGWLCLIRQGTSEKISSVVHESAAALLGQEPRPEVLAIDIPIGLNNAGVRDCDSIARKMLGSRACCVFTAPIRPVLHARTHSEASRIRKRAEGKKISAQVWGIVPKIREIDCLLSANPSLQEFVREAHPEICFMAWNGGAAIADRKKSPGGKARRAALVAAYFGDRAFARVRDRHARTKVADDDINDAFAALWTAERILNGSGKVIPARPCRDPFGLRMEICY